MNWVALVPLKAAWRRKSRLSHCLTDEERVALSDRFARHVGEAACAARSISSVVLISDASLDGSGLAWVPDEGGGLNRELSRTVELLSATQVVIISADLPLLRADDLDALVSAASATGSAIAPDRHGTGTNGLALTSAIGFDFRFGPGSFAAHRHALPAASLVRRPGLALDVDTPDDLELAIGSAKDLAAKRNR